MRKVKKFIFKNIKSILISILVIALFIFASWISRRYVAEISSLNFAGVYGELGYILISIIGALAAGISSTPLIPLALVIWGAGATVFMTAIGWTLGSLAAFFIARRYGEKLVCRLINVCDLENYKRKIGPKDLFWKLLFARVFLPVDILSYAIGLFTKMSWFSFALATFIGSAIFAFLAVYISVLPVLIQVFLGAIAILIFFFWAQNFIKTIFKK